VPKAVEEVFLVRYIRSYLRDVVWPEPGARAFFVRYRDETGPHIRFRLRGGTTWMEERGMPEFLKYVERHCTIIEQVYTPEPQRFGGTDALTYAEEHFHISSRMAITRFSRVPYVYGDTMFDSLRMLCMMSYAAGNDLAETAAYFADLRDRWLPAFILDEDGTPLSPEGRKDLIYTFDAQLEIQRDQLRESISEFWRAMKHQLFEQNHPEWDDWYRGNKMIFKQLGAHKDMALPQLMHMHNNRMGVTNYDEVYLCHILAEVMK
jgi:thiopeptide-type bacteriocin biosynthesis protein